jgi:hypothetical protein
MTSAELMIAFVQAHPGLELAMWRAMNDRYKAPELFPVLAQHTVIGWIQDQERPMPPACIALLDRMRGNGDVDWKAVADAFGAPFVPPPAPSFFHRIFGR